MEEAGETPCSACGVKPATHHITTIVHGKAEQAHLCGECFEKTQPTLVRKYMETLLKATCAYCGAKAVTGLGPLDNLFGQEDERFVCHDCFQEHSAYLLGRLETFTAGRGGEPHPDDMKQIRALRDETDSHMRRWISQKLN